MSKSGKPKPTEAELAVVRLVELKAELHEWTEMREVTIQKLREIANYMDLVSHRTGVAKVSQNDLKQFYIQIKFVFR